MTPDHSTRWSATAPELAHTLTDARRQLHLAVQFGATFGISYLPHEADDGHTNLGWDGATDALVSHPAAGTRGSVAVGVRVHDLALVVTRDGTLVHAVPLDGLTLVHATDRLRAALADEGLDPARLSLERHYEIPHHPVSDGAPFSVGDGRALGELAHWFSNAAVALSDVAATMPDASSVRLWPHHFDIATLVRYGGTASTGAGLVGGDTYYDEPYLYVNAYPRPRAEQLTATLAGRGHWHTHEWIGAVLPGSRVRGDAAAQSAQVHAFLASALAACRGLVGG